MGWSGRRALRGFMAQITYDDSSVGWSDIFGWSLLPGTIIGVLLGWAEHIRTTRSRRYRRTAPQGFLLASSACCPANSVHLEAPRDGLRLRGPAASQGYVASPQVVMQSGRLALIISHTTTSVARRGPDGWYYVITRLDLSPTPSKQTLMSKGESATCQHRQLSTR